MDEILKKANELGIMIKRNEASGDFEEISVEVENDSEASILLKKYNEIAETVQQKQAAGYVLEKFEKERFRDISEAVISNKLLNRYLAARNRYMKLLLDIHRALGGETITDIKE